MRIGLANPGAQDVCSGSIRTILQGPGGGASAAARECGARCGAPDAVQVADRWHLLRNLSDALARALDRHGRDLREAAAFATQPMQGTQPTPASPAAPTDEPKGADCHAVRRARFSEALRLHAQGWSARRIAPAVGGNRQTVLGWLRSGELPTWRQRRRGSSVDQHAKHLDRRWTEGCRNAAQLWREVQEQGFRGRLRTVQRWVSGRRGADPATSDSGRTVKWPMPSRQRASWLVVADSERLNATQQRFVDALLTRSPELAELVSLACRFRAMVREQKVDQLDGWLSSVKGSALAGFAEGIRRDLDAVRAALALPWSTGPVEGQISRLKTIKRMMCGRAGFELLRRRVLLAA